MKFPKEWIKKHRYFLIGAWFLFLQLLIFYENRFVFGYNILWWFCDHSPLIFAIAFFTKNKSAIKGLINFGFLVQIVWVGDFLFRLISGNGAFAYTNQIFSLQMGWFVLVPLIVHALSVNVAFFYTYKIKPTYRALLYAWIYIVIIWGLTLLATPAEMNVNCVQEFCGLEEYTPWGWTYMWPFVALIILVLPTQIIQRKAYKNYKSEREIDLLLERPQEKEVIIDYSK